MIRSQEAKVAKEALTMDEDVVMIEAKVEPIVVIEALVTIIIWKKTTKIMKKEDKKIEVEGMTRVKFNISIATSLGITLLSATLINLIKFMRKSIMPRRKMMEMTCFY